jgi:hypothetical protein
MRNLLQHGQGQRGYGIALALVQGAVEFSHVRIDGNGHAGFRAIGTGAPVSIQRKRVQGTHRHQRQRESETQALRESHGNAHAREGARPSAERDGCEICRFLPCLREEPGCERKHERVVLARTIERALKQEIAITKCDRTARSGGLDGKDQ